MNPYAPPRPGGPGPPPGQYYGGPPGVPPMMPPAGMPPGGMPPRPGMMPPMMQGMMPPPPAMAQGYSAPPPSSFPRPGAPLPQPTPLAPAQLPAPPMRATSAASNRATSASAPPLKTPPPPPLTPPSKSGTQSKGMPKKDTKLVVSQIAASVENEFMEKLLKACGPCTFKRPTDPETGVAKLFGFVEFEDAESVVVALKVLNNLTVDGQDLKVKANNSTQEYIDWWSQNRGAAGTEVAREDGEEKEDDDQREMRVLESVMDILSKRDTKSGKDVDDLIGSVRKEESMRGPSREDRLEREFEADQQRAQRDARNRQAQEEREYKARLKDVERLEESIMAQRRKRRRQEEAEIKERQKAIKQDNEASDSEDEEERWRRKPFRFTTAAAARKAARMKEAQDDESDRMKELEEVAAARMQNGGQSGGREAGEPLSALDNSARAAPAEVKREAKLSVNPNDGIMKAMLAGVTKDDLADAGGWQSDPKLEASAVKQEAREAKRGALGGIFGSDEDPSRARRRPVPIQYSKEEQRAVDGGGGAAGGSMDIAELRRKVIEKVPTCPEDVWNYPLKWDMLRLDSADLREKVVTKMIKSLEGMLGGEGAAGVAEDVWKMLLQRSGPEQVANFADFLGSADAREFVFRTFRLLIAESELHALDRQHGLA